MFLYNLHISWDVIWGLPEACLFLYRCAPMFSTTFNWLVHNFSFSFSFAINLNYFFLSLFSLSLSLSLSIKCSTTSVKFNAHIHTQSVSLYLRLITLSLSHTHLCLLFRTFSRLFERSWNKSHLDTTQPHCH